MSLRFAVHRGIGGPSSHEAVGMILARTDMSSDATHLRAPSDPPGGSPRGRRGPDSAHPSSECSRRVRGPLQHPLRGATVPASTPGRRPQALPCAMGASSLTQPRAKPRPCFPLWAGSVREGPAGNRPVSGEGPVPPQATALICQALEAALPPGVPNSQRSLCGKGGSHGQRICNLYPPMSQNTRVRQPREHSFSPVTWSHCGGSLARPSRSVRAAEFRRHVSSKPLRPVASRRGGEFAAQSRVKRLVGPRGFRCWPESEAASTAASP